MKKEAFINLCEELKRIGKLKHSRNLTIQEQVAIFLFVLSHNERQRMAADRFQHSLEAISTYFKKVLYAICSLTKYVIVPPSYDATPPEISYTTKYYPYFKNCVGAIDGTHVSACVPQDSQVPYRGKKIVPTMNMMCACSFDMRFTFVMSGWEGSANDSRIFLECISNPANKFPMPPARKYYLVDSGYTNMPGFLSPYRGERYHLNDYRGQNLPPQGTRELFNYLHSSLRNVIERCFGVLKKRFPILRDMPSYSLRKQKYIALACCVIHNVIRMHDSGDPLFVEFENEDVELEEDDMTAQEQQTIPVNVGPEHLREMSRFRDRLVQRMWNDRGG
ncbi:putative nuclease HARBI1 isoform X1 [Asparagus officinalis]|uniref:putative nuclease HARBI1 isoform X1 n=1 Tax=Asparagus officinalis TaxID=4686 RepID=UPI00098E461A|nr:putative nuclease HARBI1 isoform X1 [Asparagus officinalis]